MSTPTPLDLHPHDVDAEKAVLGSLLIDKEALPDVAGALTRLGFWRDDSPRWLARKYHQRRAEPDEVRARVRTIVVIRPEG